MTGQSHTQDGGMYRDFAILRKEGIRVCRLHISCGDDGAPPATAVSDIDSYCRRIIAGTWYVHVRDAGPDEHVQNWAEACVPECSPLRRGHSDVHLIFTAGRRTCLAGRAPSLSVL